MKENDIELFIYLNEILVRNLSSLVLSGYIDVNVKRLSSDKTLTGVAGIHKCISEFNENRCADEVSEGFRTNNLIVEDNNKNENSSNLNVENRNCSRSEEEFKTIFTSYNLHRQIMGQLIGSKKIKIISSNFINEDSVFEGDYVKIKGILTSESLISYLDSIINILNCFEFQSLDKLIEGKLLGLINYKYIRDILTHLVEILNRNNTKDMILICGNTQIILNVNNDYFMSKDAYSYDKVDCPCTVIGKVVKKVSRGQFISLLRKTTQHEFYEKTLDSFKSYFDILNNNGIITPREQRVKCEGFSLMIEPISISV